MDDKTLSLVLENLVPKASPCMIYDFRLQIAVHEFLPARYYALQSKICILKSKIPLVRKLQS